MTMFRYGPVAWFWRLLIGIALVGGTTAVVAAVRQHAPSLLLFALPLLLPALFFGAVVVTRIDALDNGDVAVGTLLFPRRTIQRTRLGVPRVKQRVQSDAGGSMYAPRAWIPVSGALPLYLDLLAEIPDRRVFAEFWRVPIGEMPRRRG
jgi:hypothetical protein